MDNHGASVAPRNGGVSPTIMLVRHSRVLRILLAVPGREFTVRELALESGTAYATTWRLVGLLRDLGALRERRVGAARAVSVNPRSPLVPELRRVLRLHLDPHREAARRFARLAARIPGVRKVVLFGSAARGTARPSSDVDVAVVVDRRPPDVRADLDRAAIRVQDATGLKVVPILLGPREEGGRTRLAHDIRAGEVLYVRS
jgi:predicted nucleotidyltransferase